MSADGSNDKMDVDDPKQREDGQQQHEQNEQNGPQVQQKRLDTKDPKFISCLPEPLKEFALKAFPPDSDGSNNDEGIGRTDNGADNGAVKMETEPAGKSTGGESKEGNQAKNPKDAQEATSRLDHFEISLRSHLLELVERILLSSEHAANSDGSSDVNEDSESSNADDAMITLLRYLKDVTLLCLHVAQTAHTPQGPSKSNSSKSPVPKSYSSLSSSPMLKKLPFLLLEDAIDSLPLTYIHLLWSSSPSPSKPSKSIKNNKNNKPNPSISTNNQNLSPFSYTPLLCHPLLFSPGSKFVLLRICNKLLKMLSNRDVDAEFAGSVMMTLAKVFPLSERSAVNVLGSFNVENVTEFESLDGFLRGGRWEIGAGEGGDEAEVSADGGDGVGGERKQVESTSSNAIGYDFYSTFWGVQKVFTDPMGTILPSRFAGGLTHAKASIAYEDFLKDVRVILAALESTPVTPMASSDAARTSSKHDANATNAKDSHGASTPNTKSSQSIRHHKYLTSSQLLKLQLHDPKIRIHFLTQLIIILSYLSSPSVILPSTAPAASTTAATPKSTTAAAAAAAADKLEQAKQKLHHSKQLIELEKRTQQLLRQTGSTPSNSSHSNFSNQSTSPISPGEAHWKTLQWILKDREVIWRNWKRNKCQPNINMEAVGGKGAKDDGEGKVTGGSLKKVLSGRKRKLNGGNGAVPAGKQLKNDLNDNSVQNAAGTGIQIQNLPQVTSQITQSLPTLESFLDPYVEALDPESGIEDEYHPRNDKVYCWRALRLLARDTRDECVEQKEQEEMEREKDKEKPKAEPKDEEMQDQQQVQKETKDEKEEEGKVTEEDQNKENADSENQVETTEAKEPSEKLEETEAQPAAPIATITGLGELRRFDKLRRKDGDFERVVRDIWREEKGEVIPGEIKNEDEDDKDEEEEEEDKEVKDETMEDVKEEGKTDIDMEDPSVGSPINEDDDDEGELSDDGGAKDSKAAEEASRKEKMSEFQKAAMEVEEDLLNSPSNREEEGEEGEERNEGEESQGGKEEGAPESGVDAASKDTAGKVTKEEELDPDTAEKKVKQEVDASAVSKEEDGEIKMEASVKPLEEKPDKNGSKVDKEEESKDGGDTTQSINKEENVKTEINVKTESKDKDVDAKAAPELNGNKQDVMDKAPAASSTTVKSTASASSSAPPVKSQIHARFQPPAKVQQNQQQQTQQHQPQRQNQQRQSSRQQQNQQSSRQHQQQQPPMHQQQHQQSQEKQHNTQKQQPLFQHAVQATQKQTHNERDGQRDNRRDQKENQREHRDNPKDNQRDQRDQRDNHKDQRGQVQSHHKDSANDSRNTRGGGGRNDGGEGSSHSKVPQSSGGNESTRASGGGGRNEGGARGGGGVGAGRDNRDTRGGSSDHHRKGPPQHQHNRGSNSGSQERQSSTKDSHDVNQGGRDNRDGGDSRDNRDNRDGGGGGRRGGGGGGRRSNSPPSHGKSSKGGDRNDRGGDRSRDRGAERSDSRDGRGDRGGDRSNAARGGRGNWEGHGHSGRGGGGRGGGGHNRGSGRDERRRGNRR